MCTLVPPVLIHTIMSKFIWGVIPFRIDSGIVMQKIIFDKYFNINLKKKNKMITLLVVNDTQTKQGRKNINVDAEM